MVGTAVSTSAITYCYTVEDNFLHRALSPFGLRWNTACDQLADSLPRGVQPSSPALIRCTRCFPPLPARPFHP